MDDAFARPSKLTRLVNDELLETGELRAQLCLMKVALSEAISVVGFGDTEILATLFVEVALIDTLLDGAMPPTTGDNAIVGTMDSTVAFFSGAGSALAEEITARETEEKEKSRLATHTCGSC